MMHTSLLTLMLAAAETQPTTAPSAGSVAKFLAELSLIEWVAVSFGLACVWCYIRENVWSWPTGLIQTILYVWIFYQAKLYSDVLLQFVNIVLVIYGWYYWVHAGPKKEDLPVARIKPRLAAIWLSVICVGTAALGYFMANHTDASYPYWDAAIAMMSLVAQYLLAKKVLECWLIWIVVDVIAIGVYFAKDLHLTSALYLVFLIMATTGFFAWAKTYRKQLAASSPMGAGAA